MVNTRGVDRFTRGLYWFLAVVLGTVGFAVVLLGTGIVPAWVADRAFALGQDNPLAMHLLQEQAALFVFAGLMFAWFARHYDRSYAFHWAATLTVGLLGFVHWLNAYGRFDNDRGTLINAIPFALFLALGLLRRRARS